MKTTRQERAYLYFKGQAIDLLKHDGKHAAAQELQVIFSYPGIADCLQQAFSNVLWREDERVENQQALDLTQTIKVISQIADPTDVNTQKIIQFLQTEVAEADQEMVTMSQKDIDEAIGDDEEDNTPIQL